MVVPASNSLLKPKNISEAEKFFTTADLVLVQLEIPMETVEFTIQFAKKHDSKVGIYASPAKKLSQEVIENADFIVTNAAQRS